jgi:hypothetical protein
MANRYKITFENGQTVISNDIAYITIITWEEMYNSKVLKTELIN